MTLDELTGVNTSTLLSCRSSSSTSQSVPTGAAAQTTESRVEPRFHMSGVDQHHLDAGQVLKQVVVKSGRGAVPVFRPARFLGPLPAPAVRLSPQRALHKSRSRGGSAHRVDGQGVGIRVPRYR